MFALALGAGACATGTTENGPGGSGGTAGASGNGGSGQAGSSVGSGGRGGSSGAAGTTGLGGSGSAGTTGTAGGTAGATAGSGGSSGLGGTVASGGSTGAAGAAAGRGGSTGVGGASGGKGGSSAGGSSGGSGAGGGSTGTTGCPANATFCSGFEDSTQPAGSVYKANAAPGEWTRDFVVDTSVKHAGNSSLRVKSMSDGGTSGSYRMLAVPATQGAFWARFWIRSDIDLGGEHNAFAEAAESDDPNASGSVEFAEDVGIAFNTSDDVRWPAGYGRLTSGGTNPYVLTKNVWYCVELSFDATSKIQQAYVNGAQLMNAANYPSSPKAYKIFKFGFMSFHGPDRHMWYDDVAVAPTRVGGCQ